MKVTISEMSEDRDVFEREWKELAAHVKRESSDVVLLPEMIFYGWISANPKFDRKIWEEAVDEHRRWMERLPELGAGEILGTAPMMRKGRRSNVGFKWSRDNGSTLVQVKNYLPNEPGYYEARWFQGGDRTFSVFQTGGWKAGFMICTDLWSMSNARKFGKKGVGLIATPRCTPKGSVEKWVAGGRVAAVLAGAYCISSNRRGKRGGLEFGGNGWIADPDGNMLARTSTDEQFLTVDVSPKVASEAKKTYPRDALRPD